MSELEHQREELLAEEVTDAELREILDRLGQDEFGGSGQSRVGDIVELTGIPPEAIGRILADIRKDEWERRFGLRQDQIESRVDHHEKVLREHAEQLRKTRNQPEEPRPKAHEVQAPSRQKPGEAASHKNDHSRPKSKIQMLNTPPDWVNSPEMEEHYRYLNEVANPYKRYAEQNTDAEIYDAYHREYMRRSCFVSTLTTFLIFSTLVIVSCQR